MHDQPISILFGTRTCSRGARTHTPRALGALALAAPRVVTIVDGAPIRIRQHYFDSPVAQPQRAQRVADLTGLRIWPCALPLLAHLRADVLPAIRARVGARPVRILELGAGTGALGIALAACEHHRVVLTDPDLPMHYADDVAGSSLDLLRDNVALNSAAVGARACARRLVWGAEADRDALRGEFEPFDLVVGSDLLYDPDGYASLLATLLAFARADGHGAVLGYKPRHDGEQRFYEMAAPHYAAAVRELDGETRVRVARLSSKLRPGDPGGGAQ
jgi:predicted nicotinamide N-methyase